MRGWIFFVLIACDGDGRVVTDTRTTTVDDVGATDAAMADAASDTGVSATDAAGDTSATDAAGDTGTTDAAGDTGADAPDTAAACPAPPWGSAVGDTLGDYELFDCDGAPVPLASLCDVDVAYLNTFAGWCPPCRAVAEAAGDDFATWTGWGGRSRWLFVITEDAAGETPSLAYCQAVRDDYALPMPTLVDLHGGLPAHLGVTSPNSWHVVLSAGMRIEAKLKYGHAGALERAHELLTAP